MQLVNIRYLFLLSFILLVYPKLSVSQEKIYLKFNPESKKTYKNNKNIRTKNKELIFRKNKLSNGTIKFYIKGLLFIHEEPTMEMEVIKTTDINYPKKVLSSKETECYIRKIQKIYPFGYKYPSTEYPRIFIAVIKKDKTIIAYQVRWQYYIE